MARSTKKGPFIDEHLMVKIETMNRANDKKGHSVKAAAEVAAKPAPAPGAAAPAAK